MYHRCHKECESMFSCTKGIVFLHDDSVRLDLKELFDNVRCLGIAYDLNIRISHDYFFEHGTVIRLHVVNNHIIQCAFSERMDKIFKKLFTDSLVHRIEKHCFFI